MTSQDSRNVLACGLSGAACPHNREELALFDVKVNASQRLHGSMAK